MTEQEQVAALNAKLEDLAHRAAMLQDVQAIRKVQHSYGYFMDKFLFNEVVELFSETGELRFAGQVYRGHAGLCRLYVGRIGEMYTMGKSAPVDGILADHMQLQDIVHVAPDRKCAKGRFRYFMQGATHISVGGPALGAGSLWEAGLYENEYVRQDGVWKIQSLGLNSTYRVDYQTGWRYAMPFPRMSPTLYPKDPLGPDEYKEVEVRVWPQQSVLPFHYPHPVTGKQWSAK